MKKKYPLVSIIIPAFRSEIFIPKLIKCINNLTYPTFEAIIVFDPSNDKGPELARSIVGKDRKWTIIENKKRLGSTLSLNLGIKKSKGEYIGFISCDMTMDKKWMSELMIYLMDSGPKVGGAIAKFYDYHQHGRIQVYEHYLMRQTGWIVSPQLGVKDSSKYQKIIETFNGMEGIIVKREVFNKVGLFDEDVDALIYDLDMNWRIWLAGFSIATIPSAKIYHWSLKVGRQNSKWEFFYSRMMNIFIKNYSLKSLIIYLPQFIAIYTLRAFFLLTQGNADAINGWSKALLWTVKNLKKTLYKRQLTQKTRSVSDKYLFKKIFYKGSILSFHRYLMEAKNVKSRKLMNKESLNQEAVSYSV